MGLSLTVVSVGSFVVCFCLNEGVRLRPEARGDFSHPVGDGGGESRMMGSGMLLPRVQGGGRDDCPCDADVANIGWVFFCLLGVRSTAIRRIGDYNY